MADRMTPQQRAEHLNRTMNCTDAEISCQFCGATVPPNSDHDCDERPSNMGALIARSYEDEQRMWKDLRAKLAAAETLVAAQAKRADAAEAELALLRDKLIAAGNAKADAKELLADVESDRDALAAQVDVMRRALEEAKDEFEAIHDGFSEFSMEVGIDHAQQICLALSEHIDAALSSPPPEVLDRLRREAAADELETLTRESDYFNPTMLRKRAAKLREAQE